MKLLRDLSPQLALAGIVALQISCGDSSGPSANAAASIAANSSTTLSAAPGGQVDDPPSVVVRDANGTPMAGVTVTFAVTTGGGSVTGNHQTSNASGIATVGSWTLGTATGTNTLVASTGNLSVTFIANGADPCLPSAIHALGSTTNGKLSPADCQFNDGSLVDFYTVNIPSAGTYLFTEAAGFDTFLLLFSSTGSIIGENDDATQPNTSIVKAILPPGSFVLAANAFFANVTGDYTLSSASSTAEVSNCEDVWIVRGASTTQSLQTSDCAANGFYSDDYMIFLRGGQSVTASMTSTAFDSYLEVYLLGSNGTGTLQGSNDNADGTTQNAQLVFSPNADGFYYFKARSAAVGATGAYTIAIQ